MLKPDVGKEANPDDPMPEPPRTMDRWTKRRRILYTTLLFCVLTIVYILWKELDTRVAESAMTASFTLMGACVIAYVFGAVWDDKRDTDY